MGGGVKIEAPKAPRDVGCGEGVSPSAEIFFSFFASKSHVFDAL